MPEYVAKSSVTDHVYKIGTELECRQLIDYYNYYYQTDEYIVEEYDVNRVWFHG